MKRVIHLDKDFWKKEREPIHTDKAILQKPKKTKKFSQPPKFYSPREIAEWVGMSRKFVLDQIRSGELEAYPVGKRNWGVTLEAFNTWMELNARRRIG
jgi:excisionase family DNA binding protein